MKMFRPAKIHHATIILNENKVDKFVGSIYEKGLCQLKEADIKFDSKYSYELVKNLDEIEARLDAVTDSLEEYKEVIQPGNRIKNILSPKRPKRNKSELYSTNELIDEIEYHLGLIESKVLQRVENLQKIDEQIQEKEFTISNLSVMPDTKTSTFESSDNIKILSGIVITASLTKIKEELKEKAVLVTKEIDQVQSFIGVFSYFEDVSSVEKMLHNVGFEKIEVPLEDKTPGEIISGLNKEIEKLNDKKQIISTFLRKTQKVYGNRLELLAEELNIVKQKLSALKNFKTTEAFSVLEAWVPEKDFKIFHETVKRISKQYYIEIDEREDAPTLLNNPKLVKPFEMITELYSAPRYKGFDPTPILAITFSLFFGFMLTDAAYGLILLAFGWILFRGVGKFNETMKKFATIFIMFGVSTIIMGVIFGSYFGSFFQDLGINLPVPIDSMREVMLALSIAIGIGFLHLLTGLITGFYENIRKGSLKSAMASQGLWIFFMLGLVFFLLKLNVLGLISIGLAVAMQMFFSFLEGGVVSSVLSIFDFSGFMGDLFSYARLMALAVGTSGISLAVNFMVFMIIDMIPIVGIPIAIAVFIIGHLFNIVMNGLGSFIHTTRLHFLEFFTKFYEGGGNSYKPFLSERKKTYIEQ